MAEVVGCPRAAAARSEAAVHPSSEQSAEWAGSVVCPYADPVCGLRDAPHAAVRGAAASRPQPEPFAQASAQAACQQPAAEEEVAACQRAAEAEPASRPEAAE